VLDRLNDLRAHGCACHPLFGLGYDQGGVVTRITMLHLDDCPRSRMLAAPES
jgi:hypothetical protein